MFFQSKEVNYKLPHNALEDFISFMSTFPGKPLFVGHNIKRFDCHVLYNALKSRHMLNEFFNHVCGFLDTLDYLKKLTQGLVPIAKLHLYKHFYLVRVSWLTMPMMMLQHFFSLLRKRASLTKPGFSFPCSYCRDFQLEQKNLETFSEAINAKAISKAIATKVARSNLKFSHLRRAVERDGIDGLRALMSEPTKSGKPRVTSKLSRRVLFS